MEAHLLGFQKGSLQIMNILKHPIQFYVLAYIQEYTRNL